MRVARVNRECKALYRESGISPQVKPSLPNLAVSNVCTANAEVSGSVR